MKEVPDTVEAYPLPSLGQRVVRIDLSGIDPGRCNALLGVHHGLIVDERGDTLAIVQVDGENHLRAMHHSRVKLAANKS